MSAVAIAKSRSMTEWRSYGHELANTRYSELAEINASNVHRLRVAWTWNPSESRLSDAGNESTPLMIGGVLYFTAGLARNVVAVDVETGTVRWIWYCDDGEPGRLAGRRGPGRGLAYWSDETEQRILVVTPAFASSPSAHTTWDSCSWVCDQGAVDLTEQMDLRLNGACGSVGSVRQHWSTTTP